MNDITPTSLRAWRIGRGLSQPAAARMLGINPRTLAGLESGRFGSVLFGPLAALIPLLDAQPPVRAGSAARAEGTPVAANGGECRWQNDCNASRDLAQAG